MVKVIFECYESMNPYKEEYEFDDNVTDKEIEEEWKQWVWNEIGDIFGWRRVSE